MKLVFLSHDSNYNGGAQRCLVDLLKGIRRIHPEWQLYVVFPGEGDLIEACSNFINGYTIIPMKWWLMEDNKKIGLKRKISYINYMRKVIVRLLRYLLVIRPNYGVTNTIVVPYLSLACWILNIKHLWFIHEIPNTWKDRSFVFTISTILKWLNRLSRKIIVPSEYALSFYKNKVALKKIMVINQAVELNYSTDYSRGLHRVYTVLLVGAFDSNKGQIELLQALYMIVNCGKKISCYLVGSDAGYMRQCEEYVVSHGLNDYVKFVPYINDVLQYYYLSDVLVVCSGFETFGRVAVEAQKCGLPVILTNVGANPERVVDGVNGLLYNKGNIKELAEKIELLRDENIRSKYSKNINLLSLERYNLETFAQNFIELLK